MIIFDEKLIFFIGPQLGNQIQLWKTGGNSSLFRLSFGLIFIPQKSE